MTPLIFDLVIIGLVLLSLALGYLRGLVKEVFTIFGWVAAIIATIYFTPVLRETGRELIEKKWLADLATSSAIFLGTLALCSVISYFATRTIHATKLGIIDHIFGFVFGGLRAIVLLGMAYALFSNFYSEENTPDFIKDAHTKPFLETSAAWVKVVLPLDEAVEKAENSKATKELKDSAENVKDDLEKAKDVRDKAGEVKEVLKKFDFLDSQKKDEPTEQEPEKKND